MAGLEHSPAALRSRLSGVRALLLDLDGVLVLKGEPIPGAVDALRRLDEAGFAYLILTNTSLVSRVTLACQLQEGGVLIPPDRIVTAASATAAYVRREFARRPVYALASPDALTEFDGIRLLSHDEAAQPDAKAAALVVGDAADEFTPRNMLSAFRLLKKGAAYVAMHKNRWWLTPHGATLDAGGYVVALEYAAEREALVIGKPSPQIFLEAVEQLHASGVPGPPLQPEEVAMVGDDAWNDVLGAMDAGLRAVFVYSGKHGDGDLENLDRAGHAPSAITRSIVEVVDAVLAGGKGGGPGIRAAG